MQQARPRIKNLLLATTLAAAFAAPAIAQTNVTVSGTVDTFAGSMRMAGDSSRKAVVDSSGMTTSWFGFKGTEDLGGGLVGAVDRIAADDTVVGDGVDGLLRCGVHCAGSDEFDDVAGVVVGGILDSGGCPEWALFGGPGERERLPSGTGEGLFVSLIGEPGVSDRCFPE